MINSIEVLEQLRKGKTIEQIGNEIGAVLTLAQNQYEEEVRKETEEKEKHDSLVAICNSLVAWLKKYYPKAAVYASKDMSTVANTFIETFDCFGTYSDSWLDILNLLGGQPEVKEVKGANATTGLDWKDLIDKFING